MSFQYNTATSFSEETYLESFVEAVSWTLPSDLQRSLQHLQMLDNQSTNIMKQWRDAQDNCLRGVEAALLGAYGGDNHESTMMSNAAATTTTTGTSTSTPSLDGSVTKRKSPGGSSERKKACYKCRNKKVKCDGKQSFCLFKEEYYNNSISISSHNNNVSSEEVMSGAGAGAASLASSSSYGEYYSPPQKKSRLSSGSNDHDITKQSSSSATPPVTTSATTTTLPKLDTTRPPTMAELRTALQSRNPHYTQQRDSITTMYHQLQQCSREKIHTAIQLKSMIDMALGRLNLAAIQTTPNSPDWILAKIISYNKYTKMYTLSDEDMASNEIYTIPERQVRPLLKHNNNSKWTKGDEVYAVYPDTTSFYPAVVVNCNTRNGHVVTVQFNDDWDASGVIHEKAIPSQHVMKAP
eukprot:scaffold3537_cov151-Skeletonema_menzelii.AAC.6